MSVWSRVYGAMLIPRESKFSVRRAWQALYDEVTFHKVEQVSQHVNGVPYVKIEFDLQISLDGLSAARVVQQFCDELSAIPGYLWSQIETEIRFT